MPNPLRELQKPGYKRRGNPGGPYSKALRRGPIGDNINGNSALGRFIRALEAQLTSYVGGNPDIAQRLTIDRIIKVRVQLDMFEAKLKTGNWTDTDRRTYGALHNAFRLALRELRPASSRKQPADLETYLASIRVGDRETGGASTTPSAPRPKLRRPTG